MALHHMKMRCENGHLRSIRRPKGSLLLARVIAFSKCPLCYPDERDSMCAACTVPFSVEPHHSNGQCGPCARREHYHNLPPEKLAAVRERQRLYKRARALQTPKLR